MLQNHFFAVYYLHGTFDSFLIGLGRKLSLNTQMPSKWSEREREREGETEWLNKFQLFLSFGPKCIYKIQMKQKQNRNLVIEPLNRGKDKKGNLTETVNVKRVT